VEAPSCRFVVASRRHTLMQAQPVHVSGLAEAPALQLLRDTSAGARMLVARLSGHPQLLRQAAALAAYAGKTLDDLASGRELSEQIKATLMPDDLAVLAALAAADGAPLGPRAVIALGGPPDAAARLEDLEARRVVESHSPRYTLTGALRRGRRWAGAPGRRTVLATPAVRGAQA